MYDTLLEDFEDDVTRTSNGESFDKLPDNVVEADEVDGGLENESNQTDLQAKSEEDEFLLATVDNESWSDDPVRMYLTQMGEIPLLTRQQYPGPPYRLSESPWAIRSRPPLVGEHNREIFGDELGVTEDEWNALEAAGAV